MKYNFDNYGWFTAEGNGRETGIEPPSLSETEVTGELRANYTGIPGSEWILLPYSTPVPVPIPEPIPPAPVVPESITRWQALTILNQTGRLDAVETYVGSLTDRQAQIDFTAASIWRRDWPWLDDAATALGLTEEQVDQMFIAASAL